MIGISGLARDGIRMVGDFGGVGLVTRFLLVLSTRTAATFRGDVSLFATAMTGDCGPVKTMRSLSRRAGGTVSRRMSLECGESMCARLRLTAGIFLQDSSGEIDRFSGIYVNGGDERIPGFRKCSKED